MYVIKKKPEFSQENFVHFLRIYHILKSKAVQYAFNSI